MVTVKSRKCIRMGKLIAKHCPNGGYYKDKDHSQLCGQVGLNVTFNGDYSEGECYIESPMRGRAFGYVDKCNVGHGGRTHSWLSMFGLILMCIGEVYANKTKISDESRSGMTTQAGSEVGPYIIWGLVILAVILVGAIVAWFCFKKKAHNQNIPAKASSAGRHVRNHSGLPVTIQMDSRGALDEIAEEVTVDEERESLQTIVDNATRQDEMYQAMCKPFRGKPEHKLTNDEKWLKNLADQASTHRAFSEGNLFIHDLKVAACARGSPITGQSRSTVGPLRNTGSSIGSTTGSTVATPSTGVASQDSTEKASGSSHITD